MKNTLYRITVKEASLSGHIAGELTLTAIPVPSGICRQVTPDEPDTDVEVGYSLDALEPLTLEYRGRKTELTVSAYRLFRYINEASPHFEDLPLYRHIGYSGTSMTCTGRRSKRSLNSLNCQRL